MSCTRPKSATVISKNAKKVTSLIFAFYCIFISKYFPNLMPKSASLKKLHENFMILCWCSIFNMIFLYMYYSKFRAIFCTQTYFLSQHDYLREEKIMGFKWLLHIFIYILMGHQKMPKRAWHFCFFQKMPWGLKKMPNLRFLALKMPSWQPWSLVNLVHLITFESELTNYIRFNETLPRKVSVDIFRCNYPPRRRPKKCRYNTRFWGQKNKKTEFSPVFWSLFGTFSSENNTTILSALIAFV